jgi:hypothetical protein
MHANDPSSFAARCRTNAEAIWGIGGAPGVMGAATPVAEAHHFPAPVATPVAAVVSSQPRPWAEPNVHAWSGKMSALLHSEYPTLPAQTLAARPRFDETRAAMAATGQLAPTLEPVLSKLAQRRDMLDQDLGGVSGAGLLVLVWDLADHDMATLNDTLQDIGQTCLQGDTHRLFALWVALTRARATAC